VRVDRPIAAASLTLQFLLELAALASLGSWGYTTGDGAPAQLALALGTPLLAALAWGTGGSPKAPVHLEGARRVSLQIAFFGSAAVALAATGRTVLAASFALLVTGNIALLQALGQA
jgi:hypothetical protein